MKLGVEKVLMRLAHDAEFLAAFFGDRVVALDECGIDLTPSEVKVLLAIKSNANLHKLIAMVKKKPESVNQLDDYEDGSMCRTRGISPDIPGPGTLNRMKRRRRR
jgi:hypothetical protein